jgi:hypothetical protein
LDGHGSAGASIVGYDCAKWAIASVVAVANEFHVKTGLESPIDDGVREDVEEFTR